MPSQGIISDLWKTLSCKSFFVRGTKRAKCVKVGYERGGGGGGGFMVNCIKLGVSVSNLYPL